MLTIAIVDNHPLVRQGFKDLLNKQQDFSVILEASGGEEFFTLLQTSLLPDIAIVDVNMPYMSGYEITAQLQQQFPSIKVLGVSFHHDEKVIDKMLRNGARGYVTKTSDYQVFVKAILAVANDEIFIHNHIRAENAKKMMEL